MVNYLDFKYEHFDKYKSVTISNVYKQFKRQNKRNRYTDGRVANRLNNAPGY